MDGNKTTTWFALKCARTFSKACNNRLVAQCQAFAGIGFAIATTYRDVLLWAFIAFWAQDRCNYSTKVFRFHSVNESPGDGKIGGKTKGNGVAGDSEGSGTPGEGTGATGRGFQENGKRKPRGVGR